MRQLSDFEKQVIRDLVGHSALKEQGLVLFALYLESCHFGPAHDASLMYTPEGRVYISTLNEDTDQARKKFVSSITLFNLFRELRNDGLIILLGDSKPQGCLGSQYQEGTTFEISSPINSFICEALTKYVMVTEELSQLVKNNFKSLEEKRHDETKLISYIAIGVSLVLGLTGFFAGAA